MKEFNSWKEYRFNSWKEELKYLSETGNFSKFTLDNNILFETSPITLYDEKWSIRLINDDTLPNKQNYLPFINYLYNVNENTNYIYNNKYISVFWNLSHTTILCVPIPQKNKNFATIYHFQKNATKTQKKEFWKVVYDFLKNKVNFPIYVSTHGHNVHYFHLRIEKIPKYYQTNFSTRSKRS